MKQLGPRRHLLARPQGAELEVSGDHPDRPSFSQVEKDLLKEDEEDPVTLLSLLMSAVSLFSYTNDIVSSAVVCYMLYGKWWWWVSLVPLCLSLLVVNIFSIRWYIHDLYEQKDHLLPASGSHWIIRLTFHVTLLGPIIRYAELFLYGLHAVDKKDPNREQFVLLFLQEDRDTALLSLVGSFIKSSPLLVLQMYILTQNRIPIDDSTTRAQAVSLVSSLVELSLSQCSYHRALRRSTPLKHNMTRLGALVQFLSHCCVIASRVLALAAFASEYRSWMLVVVACHWLLMSFWLVVQSTDVCATATGRPRLLEELVFNFVVGVIYIFCFVNVKDEPTRWKYTFYYFIIWIENITLSTLWFIKADPDLWFRIPLLSVVMVSLLAGLLLLGAYYKFLHPNKIWQKLQVVRAAYITSAAQRRKRSASITESGRLSPISDE
ncbi:XK-related protein 4-like [Uloborus diversus]|uniref:XK-related protein 4-like n=1 Tax=Uloborus diversus TaxID=327109 RepID=UPI00240A74EE|nr:XK-related protein 4-like [Uloborus diversus]